MKLAAAVLLTTAAMAAACGAKPEEKPAPLPPPISLGPPPAAAPREQPAPAERAPAPPPRVEESAPAAGGITKDRFPPPEGWQAEVPGSSMRLLQFRLPRADGDERDGEVAVFAGNLGGVTANIERWRGQFREVAKGKDVLTETTEGLKGTLTLLDITGNYAARMPGAPAAAPGADEAVETRMIAAVVEVPAGTCYVKATGPPATMGKWEKSIRDFILESAKRQ